MSGAIVAMGGGGFSEEPDHSPLYRELVAGGFPAGHAAEEGAALHFDAAGTLVEAVASREGARAYRVHRGPDGAVDERALTTRYLG
jgi:dipeptidase E